MKKPQQQRLGRETRVSSTPQQFEIRKNADGSRSISGTAVVFDALSEDLGGFKERIAPGAFTQSLRDNPDVVIAYQHDLSQPLGRVSSGTANVWQDSRGLQFTCKLPDTTYAQNLIALMERGDVSQMSFGFVVPPGGDEWAGQSDGTMLRTINRAILYECSVVTVPAYSQTSVSLRGAPAHVREQIRAIRAGSLEVESGDDDSDEDSDDGFDEDDPECECSCLACRSDRCADCSDDTCLDPNCGGCPVQIRAAHIALLTRRLR